jgi:GH25 family lysozyme M1 (1,4-beta-N-acetylmuramidase)
MTATLPGLRLPGYVDGIDVSSVQTITDPAAVYDAGFRFALVKCAEGLRGRDPAYRRHVDALQGAGLHVGAYAYARASQGAPAAQARYAYDAATADGRHVVRLVLDLESAPPMTTSGALFEFAVDWLEEARRSGCAPVLYSYTSFLTARFSTADRATLLAAAPLWLAQYRSVTVPWAPASEADMPKAYPWAAWQYSGDKGHRVPGIPVDCDRNLFRGDEATLRAFFGLPPE